MSQTFSNMNLKPNQIIQVRGQVEFSRIAKQIDGEELRQDQEQALARGQKPIQLPYTKLAIKNPQIIPASGDVNNLTYEEQYIQSRFFTYKKDTSTLRFVGLNKGNNVPMVVQRHGNDEEMTEVVMDGELDSNLDVTLIIKTFKAKLGPGTALEAVIINEPVRFYNRNNVLAELGIVVKPAPTQEKPVEPVIEDNQPSAGAIVQDMIQQQETPTPAHPAENQSPYETHPPTYQEPIQPPIPNGFENPQINQNQGLQITYDPTSDRDYFNNDES